MKKKDNFYEFMEIIQKLRSKNGCPWDREQTHESLKTCMIEEAAEVLSAIDLFSKTGNTDNLREELGDVLLQVALHAQIAAEAGEFTIDDVVKDIGDKMVRRHPHVFLDVTADSSEQVIKNWEEIKKKEKTESTYQKLIENVESQINYESTVLKLENQISCLKNLNPGQDKKQITTDIKEILVEISGLLCKVKTDKVK